MRRKDLLVISYPRMMVLQSLVSQKTNQQFDAKTINSPHVDIIPWTGGSKVLTLLCSDSYDPSERSTTKEGKVKQWYLVAKELMLASALLLSGDISRT